MTVLAEIPPTYWKKEHISSILKHIHSYEWLWESVQWPKESTGEGGDLGDIFNK